MEIGVEVGAAIRKDDEAEIGVGGVEESGEDDAADGDAREALTSGEWLEKQNKKRVEGHLSALGDDEGL